MAFIVTTQAAMKSPHQQHGCLNGYRLLFKPGNY